MITKDSLRKNEILRKLNNNLSYHIEEYHHCFQNETSDGHDVIPLPISLADGALSFECEDEIRDAL